MDAIGIKNLRILEDTGLIELKPITLLLGANNSGKSTFLRALPLMRQSVESRTSSPILWYGDYVDFGSFDEAVNKFAQEPKEITLSYRFKLPKRTLSTYRYGYLSSSWLYDGTIDENRGMDIFLDLKLTKSQEPEKKSNFFKGCLLKFEDHSINLELDEQGSVKQFKVNETDILPMTKSLKIIPSKGIIPKFIEDISIDDDNRHIIETFWPFNRTNNKSLQLMQSLEKAVKSLVRKNLSSEKILSIMSILIGIGFEDSSKILNSIKNNITFDKTWINQTSCWEINHPDFIELRDIIVAIWALEILLIADDYLSTFAHKISYIAPVRARAERYYRYQDLAVAEVDSQGQNLAMFINSLNAEEQKEFKKWTEKYFGFSIVTHQSEGHISLKLKQKDSDFEDNLADTGFGFSQILPILTQLWWLSQNKNNRDSSIPITFAIEQPELHLHPRMQALLADSFIETVKLAKQQGLEIKLIIETHSETLINRFGERIENKDLDYHDVNVVLFEPKSPDSPLQSKVRIAQYDQHGFLDNWPMGFFLPNMI